MLSSHSCEESSKMESKSGLPETLISNFNEIVTPYNTCVIIYTGIILILGIYSKAEAHFD